jgi:hypothetical protein
VFKDRECATRRLELGVLAERVLVDCRCPKNANRGFVGSGTVCRKFLTCS